MSNEILFFCIKINNSYSTPLLLTIFIWICALYIATLCKDKYTFFISDKIFWIEIFESMLNKLCATLISILSLYFQQFIFDNSPHPLLTSKNFFEFFYKFLNLF